MPGSVWELCCSLSICLNLFWFRASACFASDKTVINQHRVEKSAFEDQPEENSVWIIKSTTLLGIFCKISFTPTVTSWYHVHADAGISAALVCYLDATGAETSMLLNCILHGLAIIFAAQGPLWEGRIWWRAVPSYESRSKSRVIVSALIFTISWRNFQIWRFSWMLLRATENAVSSTFGPRAAICPPMAYCIE